MLTKCHSIHIANFDRNRQKSSEDYFAQALADRFGSYANQEDFPENSLTSSFRLLGAVLVRQNTCEWA
jgi:hypothetical protein